MGVSGYNFQSAAGLAVLFLALSLVSGGCGDGEPGGSRSAWRVAELLGRLYRERYIPIVPPEFKLVADSLIELPPDRQPRALLAFLADHRREDLAALRRVLPDLRRPEVRELALELERDRQRDLAVLARRLARE